jgi:hypothetical protein
VSGLSLSLGSRPSRRSPEAAALRSALLKVTAQLDLSASAQSAGEWTNWVDTLNSNPVAYNAARRPAVGAANGVPIATFAAASPDVGVWPLNATNNGTTHWGLGFWLRPANVVNGVNQIIVAVWPGTNGASANRMLAYQTNATLNCVVYTPTGSRRLTIASAVALSTWVWVRVDWTSARSGDDRLRIYINGAQASGTYAGNGGDNAFPATDLVTVTGNMLIGNGDNGAANGPFGGDLGPNLYSFASDLTAAEDLALMNLKRPA